MQIAEKPLMEANFGFLICSIYTLMETDRFFKNLSLKNNIYLHINNNNYYYFESADLNELYTLLNKNSLRRLSYYLVKIFINSTEDAFSFITNNKTLNEEQYCEILLLQKYLQKFNYHYRRYYIYINGDIINLPSIKKLNNSALKILFQIAGI